MFLIIGGQVFRKSFGLSAQREVSGAQQGTPNSRNWLLGCCLLGLKAWRFFGSFPVLRVAFLYPSGWCGVCEFLGV